MYYFSPRGRQVFDVPLSAQRYDSVFDILSAHSSPENKLSRIADFGCAQCKFVRKLKKFPGIRTIIGVDLDASLLEEYEKYTRPIIHEYLAPRSEALEITLYGGSAAQKDCRLFNKVDAVTAIELIEHLYPETLAALPDNIFGYLKPSIAVITTPNIEFNVLFPDFTGPFRHWDHKFEWTRKEFQDWCYEKVIKVYPEYNVQFSGVGSFHDNRNESLGYCTQIAIFKLQNNNNTISQDVSQGTENYNVIAHHNYPIRVDHRSLEEKLIDQLRYYIRECSFNSESWNSGIDNKISIDLLASFSQIFELTDRKQDIR